MAANEGEPPFSKSSDDQIAVPRKQEIGGPRDRFRRRVEFYDSYRTRWDNLAWPPTDDDLLAASQLWLQYPRLYWDLHCAATVQFGEGWYRDNDAYTEYCALRGVHIGGARLLVQTAERFGINGGWIAVSADICRQLFERYSGRCINESVSDQWPICLGSFMQNLDMDERQAIRKGQAAFERLVAKLDIAMESDVGLFTDPVADVPAENWWKGSPPPNDWHDEAIVCTLKDLAAWRRCDPDTLKKNNGKSIWICKATDGGWEVHFRTAAAFAEVNGRRIASSDPKKTDQSRKKPIKADHLMKRKKK